MSGDATESFADSSERRRVLVVDDEANIRDVLAHYLAASGFTVTQAADGPQALQLMGRQPPDLVILDLMLPELDGIEVCRRIRAASPVPILMLTARGEEHDKLEGFGVGADDYVTKPFSPREVVVRVQALLRRLDAMQVPALVLDDSLHIGDLVLQEKLHQVERDGAAIDLTVKEFDLLHFLARHPRQVFTRQQLLDRVWDIGFFGDTSTVTVHICRLREKLEDDPAHPSHLKTVWGVGYKFEP
jgi:DNA-binding response OmpR family regulator